MHPLAIMGILATIGGLVAAVVALAQLSRHGVAIAPVLLGNFLPLLVFVGAVALSLYRRRQGHKATSILYIGFALFVIMWWVLNVG